MKPNYEINKVRLFNVDCMEFMKGIPDGSVDCVITSPPYYNLREYSHWDKYEYYLLDLQLWFNEMYRILSEGGHICWNIQENIPEPTKSGRKYYPLMPDTIGIGIKSGLVWEKNIVWNKNNATQLLFGSYPYPPTPIFSDLVEYILVFRKNGKLSFSKKEKELCKVSKERWFEITRNVWNISAESAKRVNHTAPYPIEIPTRFIEVMTINKSIVLDPFMGSGTTGLACKNLDREFIGIELDETYFNIAKERIENHVVQEKLDF